MADVTPRVPTAADPEVFVLRSGVRSGLKREFAFALKAQAEMLMSPMSRTRSGRISRSPALPRGTAAKRPRMTEGAAAAPPAVADLHTGTTPFPQPAAAAPPKVEGLAENVIIVNVDDEEMSAAAAETAPSAAQTSGEPLEESREPIRTNSGSVAEMPLSIQVEDRAMEAAASPIPTEEESVVDNPPGMSNQASQTVEGNAVPEKPPKMSYHGPQMVEGNAVPEKRPKVSNQAEMSNQASHMAEGNAVPEKPPEKSNQAEMSNQDPQMVEGNAVPEKPPKRFTRSMLKAAVEENAVPENPAEAVSEKPMRRFTRSLLKAAVEESPPSSTVEKSPLGGAEASSAASGRSDGFEEAKDAAETANETNEQLRTTPKKKMELKMSKKIALTKIPSNIKDLLATGLLEGLTVKYSTRSYHKQGGLRGVIKGGNILCFCVSCKGLNTVSAYNFEQHAGSTKKHPSDYIYLENGSSLRDVLRACTSAPLDMLESTIQNAISPAGTKTSTCDKCKESSDKSHIGKLASVCESCLIAKLSPTSPKPSQEIISNARHSRPIVASNSSDSASKSISSQKKNSRGRMTTKDLRLHKLVFMDGILPDGTEVAYYARGQRLLAGYIQGTGIFCHCCNTVVSPSQFEAHAGWASRRKPYLNIYTSNGVSLHELSVSLSKGKRFSASENDDLCRICADGGNLLLCDLCPRAFHKECVGLKDIPKGDWYCPCCQNMHQKEKFVEHNKNAIAAGRVAGVDPIEEIFKKCIRIVKTPDSDIGGCVLCRCHDFSKNGFGPRTVLLCDQCEREFHVGCLKDHNLADLKELPEGKWFCSSDCIRIHATLQKLLTSGPEYLSDLQSVVIERKREEKDKGKNLDVRWRLLSGKTSSPETRLLLSQALSIFRECFDPIKDAATGKDLMPEMVYGRDSRDQEFGGMCCIVLTVDSSVVSAGILRVLGGEVAELPLVATSREHQGKGYFQALFLCIERMLDTLNVKHLVLPAADEAESIWIKKFGFSKISFNQLHEYTKGSRTMVFQGTSMLHKLVPKSPTVCVKQNETG